MPNNRQVVIHKEGSADGMKRSRYMQLQLAAVTLARKALPHANIQPYQVEIAWFGIEDESRLLGLINLFNETFCGKLLVSLPGWICPFHHHLSATAKKDEGFYVVYGTLVIMGETGTDRIVEAGQTGFLPAGSIHGLTAEKEGAVYFEFSERDTRTDIFSLTEVIRDPKIEEDVPDFVPNPNGFPILGSCGLRLKPDVKLKVVSM